MKATQVLEPTAPGAPASPLRILHVLGRMNRGGVETWLMHVLRAIDRERFRMDFLVHSSEPGHYDEEIRRLGCRILTCPYPAAPWTYAANFRRVTSENGPYDIVHGHVHDYSGFVLRQAARAGVPGRVAHSHTDRTNIADERGVRRLLYRTAMRRWVKRYATGGVGVSNAAAASFFGPDWRRDPRWRVIYYGVNLAPFHAAADRAAVRSELGLPEGAVVVGHVGNLLPVKNHRLLLQTTASLVRRRLFGERPVRLLLIGQGPLRDELGQQARALGVADNVVFAGVRPDVPRVLLGAADVFAFSSVWEGLPLAVIEAQAAGLPCVISDRVTAESTIVPRLVTRLSPDRPADEWADACARAYAGGGDITRAEALAAVEASQFQIDYCVRAVESLYLAQPRANSPRKRANG